MKRVVLALMVLPLLLGGCKSTVAEIDKYEESNVKVLLFLLDGLKKSPESNAEICDSIRRRIYWLMLDAPAKLTPATALRLNQYAHRCGIPAYENPS